MSISRIPHLIDVCCFKIAPPPKKKKSVHRGTTQAGANWELRAPHHYSAQSWKGKRHKALTTLQGALGGIAKQPLRLALKCHWGTLCGSGRVEGGKGASSPAPAPAPPKPRGIPMRVPRAAAPADSAGARPSVMLGTAAQVRVPFAARARDQVPPPSVPSLGDWLLDDEEEARLGMLLAAIHNRSISGRGGASPGRNTTARPFQGRGAPSLACLFVVIVVAFCSVLCSSQFTKLRVHDSEYSGHK